MTCKTVKQPRTISRTVFEELYPTEKEHVRKALLEYRKRDTLAMVDLRKTLPHKASLD
jgi:hypothetical protein